MKTNKFRDEDGLEKDDEIGDKIVDLIDQIENSLDDVAMEFYKREFDFANELTEISNRIKPKNKDNGDRKRACLEEIKEDMEKPEIEKYKSHVESFGYTIGYYLVHNTYED